MPGFLCAMVGASFLSAQVEVLRRKKGISAIGTAQVSTAQSKFGGASALFDGNSDYLIASDVGTFTTDFTIEFWFRTAAVATDQYIVTVDGVGTALPGAAAYLNGSQLKIFANIGGSWAQRGGTLATIAINTLYHLSIVRQGTTWYASLDGTVTNLGTHAGTISASGNVIIGALTWTSEIYFNGHIDEVRVSNSARYTANFTAPSAAFVNDANTLLLIHADGTNGSTFFEDDNGVRSPKGITAFGNAKVDTAQSQFGGSSLLLDGNGDYLITQFNLPSVKTLECWIRVNNVTGEKYVFRFHNSSDTFQWVFGVNIAVAYVYSGGQTSGGSISANTWAHICLKDDGTNMTMAVNGVFSGTRASFGAISNCLIYLGGYSNALGVNGYIDELRISNIVRYTANFTPSTTPHVNDANTLLLLHMDGTNASTVFVDDVGGGRSAKGITAIGNAQIDTAQSKFGGASALFDGTGDYLQLANSADFNYTGDWTIEFQWRQAVNVAAGVYPTLIATGAVSDNKGWLVSSEPTNNKVSFIASGTGSGGMIVLVTSATITAGSFNHIAVVRASSVIKIYVNGTASGSTYTTTGNTVASTYPLYIGGGIGGLSGGYFSSSGNAIHLNAHLDEIRISNTARYTANFTPSTTPFQNDANTLLLMHCDGTDASTVFTDDNGVAPFFA